MGSLLAPQGIRQIPDVVPLSPKGSVQAEPLSLLPPCLWHSRKAVIRVDLLLLLLVQFFPGGNVDFAEG